MTILDILEKKKNAEKISMVTCYDYTSATIVSKTNIDIILVGDSLAMPMHGHENTVPCTIDMMVMHTRAVVRGAPKKFILGDLPFLTMRKGFSPGMDAVEKLMQAGAQALKFEGFVDNSGLIQHIIDSGIPVMGHIGMTPQFIHQFGGFKVQGKNKLGAEKILQEAKNLEEAGCFAIVLECIPAELAREITNTLKIPTIGIGAGPHVDGQVLIWQDLLGMNPDFKPKFVKTYFNAFDPILNALNTYDNEVKNGAYPDLQYAYK